MARVPRFDDQIRVVVRQREQIRQLRIRPRARTVDRTFIGGPTVNNSFVFAPAYITINRDDALNVPEWKTLTAFRGHVMSDGPITIDWYRNGSLVFGGHVLTTTINENEAVLDPPVELADGDTLVPIIVDGDAGAVSASAVMTCSPS